MITINPNNSEEMKIALEKIKAAKTLQKAIAGPFLKDDLSPKELDELSHLSKFILVQSIKIIEQRAIPDFIIEYKGKKIGLEVERIFNLEEVQNIKSKQELFNKSANEFENKHSDIKLLANFWLNDGFIVKPNQKNSLIEEIVDFVYELVSKTNPTYPNYINKVDIIRYSGVSFNFNEGIYSSKDLPETSLLEAINKKEGKIATYKANSQTEHQWLLLVSSIGSDSFNVEDFELAKEIESQFEHIYLLEDYETRVKVIK